MEVIQSYKINYDCKRDNKYFNEKLKEQRLQKQFDNIKADDTLEITQSLEASVKESLARKQAYKDEWVSIDKLWLKAAERKYWENVKSSLDKSKPCKMSVKERKSEALKHFKQRAVKKCKRLNIDYKAEYVQSLRNGKLGNYNGKELYIRRKHLGLFFNERNGYLKVSLLKHRETYFLEKFGADNNLKEKLERNNIRYYTFLSRVNTLGWSIERASTTPPKNQNTKRFLKMYPHRAWEIAKPKQRKRKWK